MIENSKYSKREIAKNLKIPTSTLEKLLNEDFEGFSKLSLKDIANRLSNILGQEIEIIFEDEENQKEKVETKPRERKRSNFKSLIFNATLILFLVINIVFLYFLINDLRFYYQVLNENTYTVSVTNKGNSDIVLNDSTLAPNESIDLKLTNEGKFEVHNNQGEVVIKTPTEIYYIKLEDFEVKLTDGES
ncbi:hypothetical protein X924_04930 [Petrotoga sp. 9PWA.NaAc.5.4]|nr:hypothetical protein X924_04930 [Petrotoga sp. 9PWA.NaAc.5.4]